MATREALLATIYQCIDELNLQLPQETRLSKQTATSLVGDDGTLDSLGLITFLVSVEQALADRHGLAAPLLDELTAPHEGVHPFKTIATLVDWLERRGAAASASS